MGRISKGNWRRDAGGVDLGGHPYWYASIYPNANSSVSIRPDEVKIYLVFAAVYLGLAIYFITGAPHLLRSSYPEPEEPESNVEHSETEDV
jgi:hypothetical protein